MRIHRQWQIALPLLIATVFAVPAQAQTPSQPAAPDTTAPANPAPAPAKKPPKPKKPPAKPAEAAPAKPAEAAPAKPEANKPEANKPEANKPAANKPAANKPAVPPTMGGVKPTLLGQYGEWGAYTASPGGKKLCFAIAKPTSSQTNPPDRPRNPTYMFISSRPAEKVSNEVSIIIGYPFKPGTEASAAVG